VENNVLEIDVLGPEETSAMLSRLDEEGVDIEGYVVIEPEYSSLTSSILKTFTKNRDAKRSSGIEDEIFTCLRDFNGEYSASDLSRIQEEGGSNIFMNLTATKVRAAQSWIRDILLSPNEDPFTIKPTPIPSLPEDLDSQLEDAFTKEFLQKKSEVTQEGQQPPTPKQVQDTISTLNRDKRDVRDAVLEEINLEALEQMKIMERKIKDDFKEGKWEDALSEFIEDFCIFPAAIMKGPVITKKEKLVWEAGVPIVKEDFLFLNKRVNPIDVYPDPSGSCVQDGDFIEHMRLSKIELYSLKGIKGYNSEAIDKVLESNNDGSCWFDTGIESEKAEEEKRGDMIDANDGIFHALHYWGVAKTEDIEDWGLVIPDTEDENKYWEIEAILVGTEVIKCKLNDDPLKRRPYYKASYQNIPGAFWGRSLPNLMRDIQRMCNACARALASNMGLAAGPQIELYIDRLADAGDIEEIKPLKIWQVTNDPTGAQGRAINFFQVPSIANELLGVYEKFEQKADDATGIPRYSYGNDRVGGAAQALADYEKVVTPTGSIEISKLEVGDRVSNTYGGTSFVVGTYPQGEVDIFRVYFSNKEFVDCDINHRWSVATNKKFSTKTLEEILDEGLYWKSDSGKVKLKFKLPEVSAVYYEDREVPVDPYTFGAWLGDGAKGTGIICGEDNEVFDNIPYEKSKQSGDNIHYNCIGLITDLKKTDVWNKGSHTKYIPEEYLINSEEVRLEVLRGLMDTDGCCAKDGKLIFTTSSEDLRDSFIKLVRSLGGFCKGYSINKKEGYKDCYKVVFQYNNLDVPIFKIKRKEDRRRFKSKDHTLFISGVEYVGKYSATCITVDSDNSLFLTEHFIPTHNTASGLSMLLESATKSIKDAIRHIDVGLIIPRVEYQFFWNIIKNKIPYTGDIDVLALGSSTLTMKGAQTAKRQEFLQITANENDQKLMGPEGRAELLRQLGKDLGLTTKIVPSRLELRKKIEEEKAQQQRIMEMQAQQQQNGSNASLEATRIQIEGQERMHQQTQAIKAKELELKEMKDIDNALLEREKLGLMKEANIQRAAVASEGNQIKQNIARTQVAANLVGRNANS
jgi:hypothetical protein